MLAEALNFLSKSEDEKSKQVGEGGVVYRTLNPKAVTPGLLCGQVDPVTHEWIDGIVSQIFR